MQWNYYYCHRDDSYINVLLNNKTSICYLYIWLRWRKHEKLIIMHMHNLVSLYLTEFSSLWLSVSVLLLAWERKKSLLLSIGIQLIPSEFSVLLKYCCCCCWFFVGLAQTDTSLLRVFLYASTHYLTCTDDGNEITRKKVNAYRFLMDTGRRRVKL